MTKTARTAFYLDSSALVKLMIEEPESEALTEAVTDHDLISSELALVELPRVFHRLRSGRRASEQEGLRAALDEVLRDIFLVPVDRTLLIEAGDLPDAYLRSLDAIHVASALRTAERADAMITYDDRQESAAKKAGLKVMAPGVESRLG